MKPIESNIYQTYGPKSLSAKMIRGLALPLLVLVITVIFLMIKDTQYIAMLESALNINIIGYVLIGGVILVLVVTFIELGRAWLEYHNSAFMITDNALYIKTGILNRNEISIPLRHVQNIIQRQGVTEQMLGVCHCAIEITDDDVSSTSGTSTSTTANGVGASGDVILRDVDMNLAMPLRESILAHANTQRMVMVGK